MDTLSKYPYLTLLTYILISPEEMSVELIQQLYGTPHLSTEGDEQLKYSFLDLKIEKI